MSSGLQKEREIVLPPIFVSGTQVRLMSRVCLWYRLFKMKDEGLWRGSSHSLSLIYTHAHKQEHTHSGCPSFVNSQGYFICSRGKKYIWLIWWYPAEREQKKNGDKKLLVAIKVRLPETHTKIFLNWKWLGKCERSRMSCVRSCLMKHCWFAVAKWCRHAKMFFWWQGIGPCRIFRESLG